MIALRALKRLTHPSEGDHLGYLVLRHAILAAFSPEPAQLYATESREGLAIFRFRNRNSELTVLQGH
jgi:hypothetical protein